MTMQWYVLRSKANKEMALWRELSAHGYEGFYPHLRLRPVDPRSRKIRPYFPGYLFVQLNMEQVGTSVFRWMPFSAGFVTFDTAPASVPENLVHAIRRHVEEINVAGVEQVTGFKRGDRVIIRGGPFEGYEAVFDARLAGTERVRVLLRLLRDRQLPLDLSAAQIERKIRR